MKEDKIEKSEPGAKKESESRMERINNVIKKFFKKNVDLHFDQETKEDPTGDVWLGDSFSDSWSSRLDWTVIPMLKEADNKKLLEKVRKKSKDKIMVDLGCGYDNGKGVDSVIKLSQLFNTDAYFGIDKHYVGGPYTKESGDHYYLKTYMNWDVERQDSQGEKPIAIMHRSDMLEAVKKIKDNSAVLVFNGIEDEVFFGNPSHDMPKNYFEELGKEVKRIVGIGGYILSTNPGLLSGVKLEEDKEWAGPEPRSIQSCKLYWIKE